MLLNMVLIITLFIGQNRTLSGQAMRMEIQIEEVFSVILENRMSFGTIQPNHQWISLQVHDSGAGQIGITAQENVALHIAIDAPAELVLDESNTMPFRLENAYQQDGHTNLQHAIPFRDNNITFQPSGSNLLFDEMDHGQFRLRVDVYFFGQVYAGDVSPGIYSGTIGVRVEYN